MDILPLIKPFIFYTFSAIAVISSIMVITSRHPLYSAVMLILAFFSLSGIYVLMNAEIIAVFQVLVYAGAIMVLVIFVIMLLNLRQNVLKFKIEHVVRSIIAIVLSFILLFTLGSFITHGPNVVKKGEITSALIKSEGSFQLFSRALFSEYLLPFELVSLLLTVAIVGVVVLIRGIDETKEGK